ncbi:MAG: rod shape-determining protein MreC [Woeseia sp.]|nr:rod shape-determining protein MreC [Woeseia sp.]MBT8096298.1 rod shape-determining protein MreC [Woeseia sp.]NNE60116.1 rod shape-determining protein MreC [Woeseia sp.]NNL54545.1 rod shape-determining protein MreC [Woeseia sp.]
MASTRSPTKHESSKSTTLGLRWLLLAVLSILLMIVDQQQQHLDAVRKAIGATVYPLRVIVDAPVSTWRWFETTTSERNELLKENNRLQDERLLTYARLQRYAALEAENARLRAMLDATARVTDRVRVAEIMSVSSNPYRHSIVIDKGQYDDVYDGQALVDADGVIGQVIEAGLMSSQALLISDPDHALPVEVNRNGLRTIAFGTGEYDRLDLQYLANNADVQVGDLLVTSGLGGAFPAGYPVALVDTVERLPQESFARVTAKPTAALNQVREIMLIWSASQTAGELADGE